MIMSHTTLAPGVSARHTIHVSCACVFDLSSTLSSHSSFVSPIFYFILLIFHFSFFVRRFGAKPLCDSANEESGRLVNNAPLTKNKGGGQLSIHFCADGDTIETVFRIIISLNQLCIYGAVSDLWEEYNSCRTRTGRLVVAEQSDPHFAPADSLVTTPTPSIEIPAQENLLQKHTERVEKLQQPDRLVKDLY